MEKSRVVLVRCEKYDPDLVYPAIKRGMDLLGGFAKFIHSGEKIVLKPNVLIGGNPDREATVHPVVFQAVAKLMLETGAKVSYGDSSAFAGTEFNMKRAELKKVGDELGMPVADFDHGTEVSHPHALLTKRLILANGVLEADGLVSLAKFKTHDLVRFTGAVKNQFGCVTGGHKREFHLKMPDPFNFATMLVDINTFIKPRLFIMDGIVGMEGNGPYNGTPRAMHVLLFSTDPVALDAVACRMIEMDPEFVPTSKPGEKAGLGTYHSENIEVVGDNLESFIVHDFKAKRRPPVSTGGGRIIRFFKNQLTPRPVIDKSKCIGCGTCIKMCPVGAKVLDWETGDAKKKLPHHRYALCIRCYCCQETCPEGAIATQTPFLGRLIFGK
jgi:uncharacterized protein (DUF362 family)/Pyruvate/2-oxoacid:ferredoxin oxidoreductase delta subunit